MSSRTFRRSSPAAVVSFLALFVALSGSALAIQAKSVRSKHIVDGQVRTADLGRGAVKTRALAPDAVAASKLASGAVTAPKLAPGSVASAHVANESLTGAHFAGNSIGAADLASGSVGAAQVGSGAVSTGKVDDGSLSGADVGGGSIGLSDLATGSVASSEVLAAIGEDVDDAALGSPLVRNVSLHVSSTNTNTASPKAHAVFCPAGKRPLSGGAFVTGTTSHTNYGLQISRTASNGPGWIGGARVLSSPVEAWSLTVRVICANI